MSELPLDHMIAKVEEAFKTAKAWADTNFKVRRTYKLVNKKAVAQGPKTKLPDDPFTAHSIVPSEPLSEEARARYYEPLGQILATHARLHGAQGPEGLMLSISQPEQWDGVPVFSVTMSKVKDV